MANFKKNSFGKTFLAIIAVVCLSLDAWFAYIHFFGKEKTVSTTATISEMEIEKLNTVTGEMETDKKTFLEINYFNNCIELKFNQLYDENQSAFYSYGIQLMVKDGEQKSLTTENIFDGSYNKVLYSELVEKDKITYESWLYLQKCKIHYDTYNEVLTSKNYTFLDLYEYQSFDDYETPLQSTFLQDGKEFFKLQITNGNEKNIIGLKFKNYETEGLLNKTLKTSNLNFIGTETEHLKDEYGFLSLDSFFSEKKFFRAKDIYYFIESVSNSIKGLAPGFTGETYLRTPDVFELHEYNQETQSYSYIGSLENISEKINSETIIYSKIKINVHEGNLTKSSQSIFNKYREYQNYDSNPSEIDMKDYFTGRNLILATLDDLTWTIGSQSGYYQFSLSDEFKTRYFEFRNNSFIKILIDTEFLEKNGLKYSGFLFDDEFFIYQIKTMSGDTIYQGVANA